MLSSASKGAIFILFFFFLLLFGRHSHSHSSGVGDDEISFVKGDVIFVPNRAEGPKWQGVFKGKVIEK